MRSSEKAPPFARKREHPQFEGIKRYEPNRQYEYRDVSSPNQSRSLSDIWDFESKQNVSPDITEKVDTVTREIVNEESAESKENKEIKEALRFNNKNIKIQCAASYYNRSSFPSDVSKLCNSIEKLNQYLEETKLDVKAGVPGKYLHAVIGQDTIDMGCFVSTIMYAFYLRETQRNINFCTVPIINMKRVDLHTHTELKWLVKSSNLNESNLIFIDEVDLSYYDQFGSLKLVIVNGNTLPSKQEGLKEAVLEFFYTKEECSCCTLLAEMFVEKSPEILAGQGFSRLLLSGILLDTENLTHDTCTAKDKYMATLLIKGAGRFGTNGLYQMLKQKMHDISDLKVRDLLRKEFKKWTKVAGKPDSNGSRLTLSQVGMSCIGISIEEFLAYEDLVIQEILRFQESEKLRLHMIVSGYYDEKKTFKREILVSANTAELMREFYHFFDIHGTHLPIKALDQLSSKEEVKAFEIDNKLTSRRTIERLLEEFGGVLRRK